MRAVTSSCVSRAFYACSASICFMSPSSCRRSLSSLMASVVGATAGRPCERGRCLAHCTAAAAAAAGAGGAGALPLPAIASPTMAVRSGSSRWKAAAMYAPTSPAARGAAMATGSRAQHHQRAARACQRLWDETYGSETLGRFHNKTSYDVPHHRAGAVTRWQGHGCGHGQYIPGE